MLTARIKVGYNRRIFNEMWEIVTAEFEPDLDVITKSDIDECIENYLRFNRTKHTLDDLTQRAGEFFFPNNEPFIAIKLKDMKEAEKFDKFLRKQGWVGKTYVVEGEASGTNLFK